MNAPISVSGQNTIAEVTPYGTFKKATFKQAACLSGPKAIVIPQTVAVGRALFKLSINGKEYTYLAELGSSADNPTNLFAAGTSYNFVFTLKKGDGNADELDVTCGIEKWNEAPDIDVDIEK